MKKLLLLLLAIPALTAAANIATVTPSPWDLYRGTSKVSTHATESVCVEAARLLAVARSYTCRTRTGVVVSVVTDPPTPPPTPSGSGLLFTDLASAPVGAPVMAYCADGSKVTITWQGAPVAACGGTVSIATHVGRVIPVTPATIKTAVATWQAGDVFVLGAGTYSGVIKSDNWNFESNFDLVTSPATAAKPIAIVAAAGAVATLTGSGGRPNFSLANSGGGSKASNLVIAGLNLIGQGNCIDSGLGGGYDADQVESRGAENLRIIGNTCTITDTTSNTMTGMMAFAGNGSKILGNTFVNPPNRAIWNNNHALYVQNGADNVEVAYNVFHGMRLGHVIQVHQDGFPKVFKNIWIHDNDLLGNAYGDMRGITVSNVSADSTVLIENNKLRHLGQGFSSIAVYRGTVTIRGNDVRDVDTGILTSNGYGSGARTVTATDNAICTTGAPASGGDAPQVVLTAPRTCGP